MLISSQRYLDDATVQAKRAAGDYAVLISPEFEVDGQRMHVVIDGHHSLAAAIADGVTPDVTVATVREDDRIALLQTSVDLFLESEYIDSPWYDLATGVDLF